MVQTKTKPHATINIRPAASVYATYRRLSYRPWYAVAEFVDNSTQNYYDHREGLLAAYERQGNQGHLRVKISYDNEKNTLTIADNANGMNMEELTRAVVLDKPPPTPHGRCEYGMGLKTAACWFGATWTIHTTRLGSDREFTVTVHVPDLVEKHTENIVVQERHTRPETHFTVITIEGLYKPIRGRTPGRVRDQLGSMYRQDLRTSEVEIIWNGQPIAFGEPPILEEDFEGTKTRWQKDIDFEVHWEPLGRSLPVKGWVGVRLPGNQRDAGFALFRRGRVIVGGPGEGYKPVEIFGQGNTFRSQRLVGELHLDEWPVTQAKDAFDWSGGLEDAFIEKLKRASQDHMDKAEGLRQPGRRVSRSDMELASERTRQMFADERFSTAITQEVLLPEPPKTQEEERSDAEKLHAVSEGPITYRLNVGGETWVFRLHWQDQLSDAHWMNVTYPQDNEIHIFLNMNHPAFAPYLDQRGFLELLQKFVLALALAERLARQITGDGFVSPGDFRNYMNRVLRYASEIEAEYGE